MQHYYLFVYKILIYTIMQLLHKYRNVLNVKVFIGFIYNNFILYIFVELQNVYPNIFRFSPNLKFCVYICRDWVLSVFREQSHDRDRDKDKKRDREEDEEEAYERRKLERKLREKEAAYQEVNDCFQSL